MRHPSILSGALVVLALTSLAGCGSSTEESQPITLTILHTNDTHSHLEAVPLDSELSAGNPGPQQGGIARRKTVIDALRASEPNVLLVDSGDRSQETMFYTVWKGSAEVMAANALGYDAMTLGNHEFDLGSEELGRALRGGPVAIGGASYATEANGVPLVASNVDASGEPALDGLLVPQLVVERGGEKIGILGVVARNTPAISKPGTRLRFLDELTSVQQQADRLMDAGINKIVLLSHCGYEADLKRAPQWAGIDVIVSGHDHALLGDAAAIEAAAPAQGKLVKGGNPTVVTDAIGQPTLVVSDYEWGRWLGRLQVSFDARGIATRWNGQPVLIQGCSFVRGAVDCSAAVAPADATVAARVAQYRAPFDQFSRTVIGQAGVAFDGSRTPGLRTQEMPLGNLVADTMLAEGARSDQVVAVLTNAGGIRAGLRAGSVTWGDVYAVLPFGDTLVALDVSGEELLAALDLALSNPGAGIFPQVAGLKLNYCAAAPCPAALRTGGRVTSLVVNGAPVDKAATYRIAVNRFMSNGGDGMTMLSKACTRAGGYCRDSGLLQLDLLVDEFRTKSPVVRSLEGRMVAN